MSPSAMCRFRRTTAMIWGMACGRNTGGRGIATEAARAVLEQAKAAGLPFLTATHDRNNPASGRVMEHIGMTYRYSYVEQWQPKDVTVTFRMLSDQFSGRPRR